MSISNQWGNIKAEKRKKNTDRRTNKFNTENWKMALENTGFGTAFQ